MGRFSTKKFKNDDYEFDGFTRQKVCQVLCSLLLIWMVIFIAPMIVSLATDGETQDNHELGKILSISGMVLIVILAITSCCCVRPTKEYRMCNIAHIFFLSLGVSCTLSGISLIKEYRITLMISAGIVIGITATLNSIVFALPEKCLNRYLFSWVSVMIVLVLLLVAIGLIIALNIMNFADKTSGSRKGLAIAIPSIFIIIFTFIIFNEIAEMRIAFSSDSAEDFTMTYFVFNLLFSTFQLLMEIFRLLSLTDG